ncbi:hypothetical protein C4J81_15165 [Deltaproteobacteria bacterium Smac51]|nr:hypothetical protein C4J81_15165 [Deltaproteobacteria bacterium Smac51]
MADLKNFIKAILSDTKFDPGGNSASKVYRDEPILLTASQMERYTPSKYRAMRKMAQGSAFSNKSEARIFCEQGKFMEDFEDDFDYQGQFVRYFPTYQGMNDNQLRGYFSWRTKVRRGQVEPTSLSFAFVYIYELLNQIGVKSPEEGYYTLKDFWTAYREIAPQIDPYVETWLKDYIVYYNLDKSLLEDFFEVNFDQRVLTLLNHKSHSADEVFAALNFLSSYDLENSRFFKQYPMDVKSVTYDVFSAYSDYYGRKRKKTLCEKLFGKVCSSSYFMFKSAVFYRKVRHRDFVYEINELHKYSCHNGNWTCARFFHYSDKNKQIGAMLKTIDFLMRGKYNFKSTLKTGKATKTLEALIEAAIDELGMKRQQAARSEIRIDLSRLQDIRTASLATQSKLIVEEPEEVDAPVISEKVAAENKAGLSDVEIQFISRLLHGQAHDELIRSGGLMLSVLIDSINEKLFEQFGDTVIVEAGDGPELVEDYVDELKEMF